MIFKGNSCLEEILKSEKVKLNKIKNKNININIARGKPSTQQVDITKDFFDNTKAKIEKINNNYLNYGMLDGIPEIKKIFADILEVDESYILVGGNSSLKLMYDIVQIGMQFGFSGNKPWNTYKKIKFLAPVPGYDRHFAICEHFGIELVNIEMDENGPDMDVVEKLVKNDDTVKGIWCVPKYSNPTGITYSDEVVDRLAKMPTKAKDFRIFWDNAYVAHDLYSKGDVLKEIFKEAKKHNNEDRIYEFASTSKITFSGGGVACIALSEKNKKDLLAHFKYQIICHDKINQALHAAYIKDIKNLRKIIKRNAEINRPKFETILKAFDKELGEDCDIATWTKPRGGYFISLDVLPGCAKAVYELAKTVGLSLTPPGSTYPYKKDKDDKNIRIAPTYTSKEELNIAAEILTVCIKIVCIEKLLKNRDWEE